MDYELKLGTLTATPPDIARSAKSPFRIAVLGDFSGRANSGKLETGDDLAARKPLKVEFDNLDDVLARFGTTLRLPIGADGGTVELSPTSIDDLHPDELYENLELFEELSDLRGLLDNSSTFAGAASEIRGWLEEVGETAKPKRKPKARGAVVPVDAKLSDFAKLMGHPTASEGAETAADELIKQMMAPYVVPDDDPEQETLVAAVDQALTGAMRSVLHHPDFQALESAWRSLDFMVRRLETGAQLQVVVYDITAEELAADLSATDALEESGLYKLLVEQPVLDAQQGPLSIIIGNYTFEQTPPHAELLGRIAKIASHALAPFIASVGPDCIDTKIENIHHLVKEAWDALSALPEAAFLGLALPRFMLRMPYGARSDPIDPFEFEEFDAKSGLRSMLWANPAILAGVLLGQTFTQQGAKMKLGSVLGAGEMPFQYYTDADGDQIALPCTDRLLTERKAAHVIGQKFMPLLSIRGRPEVRLGSLQSLAGKELAGPWLPADALKAIVAGEPVPEPEPEAPAEELATEDAGEDGSDDDMDALLGDLDSDDGDAGDEDLDALLGGLDSGDDEDGGDDDLDALLSGLGDDDEADDDEEMDPDLAALLGDL